MSETVEFYFDFVSPYTYLASTQMDGLAERTGCEIVWKPFLLGGVFKAVDNRAPLTVKGKGAFMVKDLENWSNYYGVPFKMNTHFPFSPISALRMALAAEGKGELLPFSRKVFHACWAENKDISNPEILTSLANDAGLEGDKLLEETKERPIKDKLRANTDEAIQRGAFGAPTFFTRNEMFWGNDRIHLMELFIKGEL